MAGSESSNTRQLLLLIAGAKGAVESTMAVAVASMKRNPQFILPSLSTGRLSRYLGETQAISFGGWDAIDFQGMFGLPMSIWLNLLGRDSILAAPIVIDLARWITVLKMAGRVVPVPELAFFFKKAVGDNPPLTFEDQIASLQKLERECDKKILARQSK